MNILSLGAGWQSSTVALMAGCGELTPMPDCGIFADTQAEPGSVYEWLDYLCTQLPFPVHRVTAGNLRQIIMKPRKTGVYPIMPLPVYSLKTDGQDGGLLNRSCTRDYKITPIVKKQRALVGPERMKEWRRKHKDALDAIREATKNAKARKAKVSIPHWALDECQSDPLVVSWIGISTDEASRMKPSREPWIKHRWPLIESRMSRKDCGRWLAEHGFKTPPKSSCTFCPYHSDKEWAALTPNEFQDAIAVDELIRNARPGQLNSGALFLHRSRLPLAEVKLELESEVADRQLNMFENECEGMCGV